MENAQASPALSPDDARAALAAVATDRRRLADVVRRGSRWYAPAYGVIVAGLLLTQAGPAPSLPLRVMVGIGALGALAATYRLRTGMWPRGGTATHESALVTLTLVVVVGMLLSWAAWHAWDAPALGVTVAVVAGGLAAVLSHVYDHATARVLEQP